MADLSVIIVNYNSGWFASNLVDSLLDQEFYTPSGDPGRLELIVVDNASPEDQRSFLDPLRDRDVRVVYSEDNSGYSGGNNKGMEYVTSDWLMIMNPDVVLMPGALQKMLEHLYADSRVGMVGPRGYLDPGFHFFLPPVEMPDLRWHLYESAGRLFKPVGRRYSLARSRYALRYWSGNGVQETDVISGYCFLMPTPLARKLGPFDIGFPFYYEDNDLSLRVAREGLKLLFVKDARVIHFFNKSAGPVFEEVIKKYDQSKSYFFRKHYGRLRHLFFRLSTDFLKRRMDRLEGAYFGRAEDLGELAAPPELEFPVNQSAVVEITLDPAFVLAAGHLHGGGTYSIPRSTWDVLDSTVYFMRFLDPDCRGTIRTARWKKTTPALLPPTYAELKEGTP